MLERGPDTRPFLQPDRQGPRRREPSVGRSRRNSRSISSSRVRRSPPYQPLPGGGAELEASTRPGLGTPRPPSRGRSRSQSHNRERSATQ
jgi:hypothetical protein